MEKKESIVGSVVKKLRLSSEEDQKDMLKKLGITLYHQQLTARNQEAITDSSLAIYDLNENVVYRMVEAIALVNLRMTGLQGRTRPELAQLYGIWLEILHDEWIPLIRGRNIIAHRLIMRGEGSDVLSPMLGGLKALDEIVQAYTDMHVLPFAFRLLVRTFGEEAEIPQFVALLQQMTPTFPADTRFKGEED